MEIAVQRWGTIPFEEAWKRQRELAFRVEKGEVPNTLVLCQHPSVITIGRNGTDDNVVVSPDFLRGLGIDVVEIDRGGDVTLHNPGQLVGYPVFNLTTMKPDLHWYLRTLEDAISDALLELGIVSGTVSGLTGVWIESARKICAMGIHCKKWVTYHGFALNIVNDLQQFSYIVPCGITDKAVTSVALELGRMVDFDTVEKAVENRILKKFSELWNK